MSVFLKRPGARQIYNIYRALNTTQARNAGQWYPELKPMAYPVTKEERAAAAKKYNLLPEEYEPYPNDTDEAAGDYPKLPFESVDARDPWYPWDNEELRKGFGEPVNVRIMQLLPEINSTKPEYISPTKGTLIFLGISAFFLSVEIFLHKFKIIIPTMEHQLVTPGVRHYTFEIEHEDH